MALTFELATDLANGDFSSGDITGWTTVAGNATNVEAYTVGGSPRNLWGGSSNQYDEIQQPISIPEGASEVELTAIVGNAYPSGYDLGSAGIQFYDASAHLIGGLYIQQEKVGIVYDERTVRALVPDGAVSCTVHCRAGRNDGTHNHGRVGGVSVGWWIGDDSTRVSDQALTNGDFETGDLTGWITVSGSTPSVDPGSLTDAPSNYILSAYGPSTFTIRQVATPPENATGYCIRAIARNAYTDPDEIIFKISAVSAGGGVLQEQSCTGPMSMASNTTVGIGMRDEIPDGTADVWVEISSVTRAGGNNNFVDNVELYWILEDEAGGSYGQIFGTVTINDTPAPRQLIGISYRPQVFVDPVTEKEVTRRIVVGETISAPDGTYTLQTPGFLDEVIVLALDDYGEVWKANQEYSVGQRIRPTKGNETGYGYDIAIAGNSGATEPAWWVPVGGSNQGQIGTAVAEAAPLWWSVAHAPILPQVIGGDDPEEEDVKKEIETIELTTAGEFDFDSIPQTYKRLVIEGYVRGMDTDTSEPAVILLNDDDVLANYHCQFVVGKNGTSSFSEFSVPSFGTVCSGNSTQGAYSRIRSVIEGYADPIIKMANTSYTTHVSPTDVNAGEVSATHKTMTSAVTRVRIRAERAGSNLIGKLTLYGEL